MIKSDNAYRIDISGEMDRRRRGMSLAMRPRGDAVMDSCLQVVVQVRNINNAFCGPLNTRPVT